MDTIGLLGFALNINGLRPFHFLLFGKGLCYDPEEGDKHPIAYTSFAFLYPIVLAQQVVHDYQI
jgi:hypothetical protein